MCIAIYDILQHSLYSMLNMQEHDARIPRLDGVIITRKMREHPNMLTTQRALNRLWHCKNQEVPWQCLTKCTPT